MVTGCNDIITVHIQEIDVWTDISSLTNKCISFLAKILKVHPAHHMCQYAEHDAKSWLPKCLSKVRK